MTARRALGTVFAGLVLLGVVAATETVAQTQPGSRASMYQIFATSLVVAVVGGWWLARVHRRLPSLRWSLLIVAVAAVVVTTAVVAASTSAMFLGPAELRLVLAALLLGAGLGVLVATSVTGPLTADLRELAEAAHRVAEGDLGAHTAIDRRDEVGDLARSLDQMIDQLAGLEAQREREEAARRQLFTAIGHDLRTPLSSLQAAIESLQDGVAPDPDRYLASMGTDVAMLRGMVNDLFELVRLEVGELRLEQLPVDLTEIADSAVEAVTPLAARRGTDVRLDAHGPVYAIGDPRALDRVLRNLLDNALRHAPRDTTVLVRLDEDDVAGTVRVIDEGPGFPSDFVAQAFERFTRADVARERAGGGAGLGLAIAKELIEAHGGRIWIESGPRTTVAFRVSRADGRPAAHSGRLPA